MTEAPASSPPPKHWTEAFGAGLLVTLTRLVTGAQAHWVGAAPTHVQRVYFANHSSHLDALVLWAALPPELRARTRPVAAADYWDRPGLRGWVARNLLNTVLVDRSSAKGGREALARLNEALTEGASLILFPEGTRGDGITIGELKPGLYFVAKERPDVELVPVSRTSAESCPRAKSCRCRCSGAVPLAPRSTLSPAKGGGDSWKGRATP
jgi:1-acyl-sn-glycerol-3-phosphate acyltransferase